MSRKKGPRSDGPRPRRSFTPAQKLDLLTRYEQSLAGGQGGAFLSDYLAQRLAADYLPQPPAVVDLTDATSQVTRLPEQLLRKRPARDLTSVAR